MTPGKCASEFKLEDLVGKTVVALRAFSGIPRGTTGRVASVYHTSKDHAGIMVEWNREQDRKTLETLGHKIGDGFGRDQRLDETQWLGVVEP